MALILFNNGVIKEYKPRNLIFTEDEILHMFNHYPEIITTRLGHILNTWCVYGKNDNPDEFSRIASDIIDEEVCSAVLFIHDSEINPEWNVTDNILYKGYDEFINIIKREIDDTAADIIEEYENVSNIENNNVLPQLITLGSTSDNRLLFAFNPEEQTSEFYTNKEFNIFSKKVFEYITQHKIKKEPFTIYADNKAIIIIETSKVEKFLDILLESFKNIEEYESCNQLTKIKSDWIKLISTPKIKKPRKVKSIKKENEDLNER
jgi:hypothetical protein